ncbi:hypothetical protein WICPIJ_008347, partial [Wickerhamomyces pijperi]
DDEEDDVFAPRPFGQKRADTVNLQDAHVTFQGEDTEEEEEDDFIGDLPRSNSTAIRRHRWGTQRHKNGNPLKRNKTFQRSISKRIPGRRLFNAGENDPEDAGDGSEDRSSEKRNVYWNLSLPDSEK